VREQLSVTSVVSFLLRPFLEGEWSFCALLYAFLAGLLCLFGRRGMYLNFLGENILFIDFLQSVIAVGSEIFLEFIF